MNLEQAIREGSGLTVERRVLRYDVDWGVPEGALPYRKYVNSLLPAYYYKFNGLVNSGHLTSVDLTTQGSAPQYLEGHVDTTDTCAQFDGTNYCLAATSRAEPGIIEKGYSVVAWFKYTTSKVADQVIAAKASASNGSSINFIIGVGANDFPYVLHSSGVRITYTTKAKLDDWNSVVVTVRPEAGSWRASYYLNGNQIYTDVSASYAPSASDTAPFAIASMRNGSGTYVNKWVGSIDEVSLHMMAFNRETVMTLHNLGYANTYLDPTQDFDTTGITLSEVTPTLYKDLVLAQSPMDYYKFDVLTSGTTILNEKSARPSLVYGSGTSALVASALNPRAESTPGYAKGIGLDAASTGTAVVPNIGSPTYQGTSGAFSVSFWFKPNTQEGQTNGNRIFELQSRNNSSQGYSSQLAIRERSGGIQVGTGANVGGIPNNTWVQSTGIVPAMVVGSWYHVAVTISEDGQLSLFIDGDLVATYANVPMAANKYDYRYVLGVSRGLITGDEYVVDELATYSRLLTGKEVSQLYRVGKYGSFYSYTFTGVPVDEGGAPYRLSQQDHATLINEEDVTEYVDLNYSIERDISNVIESTTLNVYPGNDSAGTVINKFKANTYIKIEHRVRDLDTEYDSGWTSMGHFLSDGIPAESYSAQSGRNVVTVVLRGVLKLLTLDTCVGQFEPDKVYYPKQQLEGPQDFGDYKQFIAPDPNRPGEGLYNLAPYPKPTLYVTDFSNLGDEANGGPISASEVIPIKGSNGAVRIQGGAGEFQFDTDYFVDKFSENGIGNPQKVYAEFWKWVTVEDVDDNVAITSVKFNKDRWYIETSRLQSFADGKTMFIKTGQAKGKRFKITQYGATNNLLSEGNQGTFGNYRNSARAGSTGTWTNVSSLWRWSFTAPSGSTILTSPWLNAYTFSFPNLVTQLTVDDVPRNAKLKGITLAINRKTTVGSQTDLAANRPVSDLELRISKNGTQATPSWGANRAKSAAWISSATSVEEIYGGELDTWGLGTPTVGELNTWLSTLQVFYAVQVKGSTYSGQAHSVDVESLRLTLHFEDYQLIVLLDKHGFMINPRAEGLTEGDVVTIGNYNSPDVVMKDILSKCGFQEKDSTKPFYMDLEPCPIELAASVEPRIVDIEDGQTHLEVFEEIKNYAPPDYRVWQDRTGVVRGRIIGLTADRPVDYTLDAVVDANSDSSDFGIATRVIVKGKSRDRINVAKSVIGGGTAAVRSYQLSGFADTRTDATGKTLTQAQADDYLALVFDGNAKTPVPTGDSWRYGTPNINRHYGVILNKFGSQALVKRWNFSNIPLCAVDIGRAANGTQIAVEELAFTHFNHFYEVGANPINQTMRVYYMTEADYMADSGSLPPEIPDADDTSYFPFATAKGWRLLVDEFAIEEGETIVTASDFVEQKPVKARFFKFEIVQANFRYPIQGGDSNACARVVLSSIEAYTSQEIFATAELGSTGIFNTPYYRDLNTRLRRRTVVEPLNLYLDTYDKALSHAENLLRERYIDFVPYSVNVYHPFVSAGDRVAIINPKTGISTRYLVVASANVSDLSTRLQLVDYDMLEN